MSTNDKHSTANLFSKINEIHRSAGDVAELVLTVDNTIKRLLDERFEMRNEIVALENSNEKLLRENKMLLDKLNMRKKEVVINNSIDHTHELPEEVKPGMINIRAS